MDEFNFIGRGTRLVDTDLPRLGSLIGVGEDEVHAFLDVETRGRGYDAENRPVMLFEPHILYRNLSGNDRLLAVRYGVAYPHQGEHPYPKDSYPRLLQAATINLDAALKSASWGIGQVLGENFVAAGFADVQSMVHAMVAGGESAQLLAAISFIRNHHLDVFLRDHNWPAFAYGYNGSHYAANAYDQKLAAAYRKWQAIRDTPYPLPAAVTMSAALGSTPDSPVVVLPAGVETAKNLSASVSPSGTQSAPMVSHGSPVVSRGKPRGLLQWVESLFGHREIG